MRQPHQVQDAFRKLARWRDAAVSSANREDGASLLAGLADRLHGFLEEFDRHAESGIIDVKAGGADAAATICAGLGLLSELADADAFAERSLKSLRRIASRLTGKLAEAIRSGMHGDADSADPLLSLSTWCSRGLKARLLQSDDANVRKTFRVLLTEMGEWARPMEDGSKRATSPLNAYRLGVCFVQINTTRQFGLLHLDGDGAKAKAHRAELQAVLRSLCRLLPERLAGNGVQLANVCNTLKDCLDAGLLPEAADGWLMPAIAVLLQHMPGVSRGELMQRGGQVLSNFGNFLRMLFELGLHQKGSFVGCAPGYREACGWLCAMLAEPGFALHGQVGQTLANLMSFVKAMARMEEQLRPSGAKAMQEAARRQSLLNLAAQRLLALLAREDMQRLSTMSISALLSALAWLRARGMASAGECSALAERLLEAIPSKAARHWDAATVALSLRAIVQLQPLKPAQEGPMKAAYRLLLGLAAKHRVNDDGHRLYCLQALRLGLQQAWSGIDDAAMQAALQSLLRWTNAKSPGLADLDAALGALVHREEPAPAPLEGMDVQEQEAPAPQPGTPAWIPPGGKLASASSHPEFSEGRRMQASTTWRDPQGSTATATATSTTTTSTAGARSGAAPIPRAAAARDTDPQTLWFELASSERHDEVHAQRMIALAHQHPQLVNAKDGGGYGGIHYAVLTGKLGVVQWLLAQPGFALGTTLQAFRETIEEGMLDAVDPKAAKQAYRHFLKAAARFGSGAAEEEDDEVAPAVASTTACGIRSERQPPAAEPGRERKPAAKKQAAKEVAQAQKAHGDADARRQEWLRLARNPNSGKAALQRMKALAEIDPDIIDCRDEAGLTALGHAIARKDRRRVAWLQPLYGELVAREMSPLVDMVSEMDSRLKAVMASGVLRNRPANDSQREPQHAVAIDAPVQPDAKDEQVQRDDAFMQDDAPRLCMLLRTRSGRKWAEECDSGGHNKLMLAAHMGRQRIVEALLDWDDGSLGAKASVYGYTAFLIAAGAGHANLVKAMLKASRGKLASQRTPDGMNALMVAANRGKLDCVKYLLAWNDGALVKQVTRKGENALIIAARGGWTEVVRTLLAHDDAWLAGTIADNGETAMTAAAECGHAEVVRLLMGSRFMLESSAKNSYTPLLLAAREGHAEVLRLLLESHKGEVLSRCVTMLGQHALLLAAENGHRDAVKLLAAFNGGSMLKKEMNVKCTTSLMLAAKNHHVEVVETLLDLGGEELARREDANGDTAFVIAAIGNAVDVLRCLLRRYPALAMQLLSTGTPVFKRALGMAFFHRGSEAVHFLTEQAGTFGWQGPPAGPSPAAPQGRDEPSDAH
jgi:ankyrin repeat protein